MKRPLVLTIAPLLLVVKSGSIFYLALGGHMEPRYIRNTSILAGLLVVLAVLLFFRPRIARWPVGICYAIAVVVTLAKLSNPDISIAVGVEAIFGTLLGAWVAHGLLVDKKVKTFVHSPERPNKAPEPTTTAVTIRAPSSTARASRGRGSS